MAKTHLTLDDRRSIYRALCRKETFAQIGRAIGKSETTIAREVSKHSQIVKKGCIGRKFNDCINRARCNVQYNCDDLTCNKNKCSYCNIGCGPMFCKSYKKEICEQLTKPPYVCNGCINQNKCTLERRYYHPEDAQNEYKFTLKDSRSGFAITEEDVEKLNDIIGPLAKKGHSIYNILETHKDEIMYSEKSIYTYVKSGVFKDCKTIDLPRAVRYKKRANTKHASFKVDKKCRVNRTYQDFNKYMAENSDSYVVELDTVEGKKTESKVILTIHFIQCKMQLAFIRDSNDAASVINIFDMLYEKLGDADFKKLFMVCLGDNGSEFSDPSRIECDANGVIRTTMFYCDPNRSDQKGACENNHEMIRKIIPKGTSIQKFVQEDMDLMMNHINSYKRLSLGGKSPYEVFIYQFGLNIFRKLGLKIIPQDEIVLKPSLLNK